MLMFCPSYCLHAISISIFCKVYCKMDSHLKIEYNASCYPTGILLSYRYLSYILYYNVLSLLERFKSEHYKL